MRSSAKSAHKKQNAVRAAYHRSAYIEERVRMIQWWADFLDAEEARGRNTAAHAHGAMAETG